MPSVHFTVNLRRHVSCPTVDVPGATEGRIGLSDPVAPGAEIYLMQALSGG